MCRLKSIEYSDCKHTELIHENECESPYRDCDFAVQNCTNELGSCTACKVAERKEQTTVRRLELLDRVETLVEHIKLKREALKELSNQLLDEARARKENTSESGDTTTLMGQTKTQTENQSKGAGSAQPLGQQAENLNDPGSSDSGRTINRKRKLEQDALDNTADDSKRLSLENRLQNIFSKNKKNSDLIDLYHWEFLGQACAFNLAIAVGKGNENEIESAITKFNAAGMRYAARSHNLRKQTERNIVEECKAIIKEQAEAMVRVFKIKCKVSPML